MEIIFSKNAAKIISGMDRAIKSRIKKGIEGLIEIPPAGDVKMMQGIKPPCFRLRVGKYRIIYEYTIFDGEQVLMIKDIGSRGDIYK